MTTGYYHNHRPDYNDRNPDGPGIDNYFDQKGFKHIDLLSDARMFEKGAIVFAHVDATDRERIFALAKGNSDTQYVFMSTAPSTLYDLVATDNVHVCAFPANHLREYEEVEAFFQGIEKGELRWQLLRRRGTPQWLVAAYVALVGQRHGMPIVPSVSDPLSDLWNETQGILGSMGAGVPKSWSDIEKMNEDALDAAIDQVKACLKKFAI